MDVEVEDAGGDEFQIVQPGFFFPLSHRGVPRGLAGFHMPTHLQPPIETPVMMEQKSLRPLVDDEEAAGQMARDEVMTTRDAGAAGEQRGDSGAVPGFLII